MAKYHDITLDGHDFHGAPAVVRYLQMQYGHGSAQGLRRAIERVASTYLSHALILQHKSEAPASTSSLKPNIPWEPERRYLGRPPLLRIRH